MKRFIGFLALCLIIGVIATQALGVDRVERRDKKGATTTVAGKILEENAAGVKVKPQGLGKEEVVPSNEIVRVTYEDVPIGISTAMNKFQADEANHNYPVVLKGYEAIQAMPEAKTLAPPVKRYFDYRVVSLRAAVAENDEQLKAAAKGLADFITANADSWEYPHAARQLARLQADVGDYASATRTFETLEKSNVPAEFKQESTAALIDIAFQSENYDDGAKRLEAASKNPNSSPALKARLDMYQLGLEGAKGDVAASVKKIEDAINKASDPSLKALGYNVLGDLYLSKMQRRDAMWSYLWVDVVYNQDRGEHLKAMTRLIKIFNQDGDKDKETLYKEKLARSR
jgi:hypothetical protein